MKKLSCVIFDLDGTVTQTNELIFAAFNHVANKYVGTTYTPKEIIAMFGPPEEVAIEKIVGDKNAGAAMRDFYAFYEEHLPHMAQSYRGIREILEFLHAQRVALGVFTGKGTHTTSVTLEHFGLRHLFDVIVTGTDVVHHKPSAEGIFKIMERLNLLPENVLMVGDAVSDVKAAREAGVAIASVLWDSYGKADLLQMDVDCRFHTVSEFDAWLRLWLLSNGAARS